MVAVYVPTNHLYLGDIVICERARASFPDITVEEGLRIFLTGGMALPPESGTRTGTTGRRSSEYNPSFCFYRLSRPVRGRNLVIVSVRPEPDVCEVR